MDWAGERNGMERRRKMIVGFMRSGIWVGLNLITNHAKYNVLCSNKYFGSCSLPSIDLQCKLKICRQESGLICPCDYFCEEICPLCSSIPFHFVKQASGNPGVNRIVIFSPFHFFEEKICPLCSFTTFLCEKQASGNPGVNRIMNFIN